jgi:hypothetical protein
MFPEDFSRAGSSMKEHPLSWWGVLDPLQGEGKYRSVVPPPAQMMDSRIHAQAPPPGQLQAQPQQQQNSQQLQQQQQQQPQWPTHGRDRGGRPMENGGGMTRGGRQGPDAGPGPPRWNGHGNGHGHGPAMEQGPPWMGPGGGGPRHGNPEMRMPSNGDAFRGGGGGPGIPPNGGRGGGGGPGPGRGRPHAPHSRQHGRR